MKPGQAYTVKAALVASIIPVVILECHTANASHPPAGGFNHGQIVWYRPQARSFMVSVPKMARLRWGGETNRVATPVLYNASGLRNGASYHVVPETDRGSGRSAEEKPSSGEFKCKDSAVVTTADVERIAKTRLEPPALRYYAGAAAQEQTLKENGEAFKRIYFRPQLLEDVSRVHMKTSLLGQEVSMPVGISPSALHQMAHPIGEVGTAQASEAAGTVMILSVMGTISLEEVRRSAPNATLWMQTYLFQDRSVTESVLKRAASAGYSAIVLTADSPVRGTNVEVKKNRFRLPHHLRLGTLERSLHESAAQAHRDFGEFGESLVSPTVTWDEIDWLRNVSGLPVVVKGVLTPEAAVKAYKSGASAIIVSNHGGRQLDGVPASIDVLPEIVAAVGDHMEVYLDGGVRTGADVAKALSLGARAVFVGRPALWGLAYNGKDGVRTVLEILRSELKQTLQLLGCANVHRLSPKFVMRRERYSTFRCQSQPDQPFAESSEEDAQQ